MCGQHDEGNPLPLSSLHYIVTTLFIAQDFTGGETEGRDSSQSLNSELKAVTPPGDEIWIQKCHELDFQVVLLKEERSNLLTENEELYGKVREAQTLSRKDSVKAKQMETEVENLRDEFDRLRLLYESIREYMENMEVRTLEIFLLLKYHVNRPRLD